MYANLKKIMKLVSKLFEWQSLAKDSIVQMQHFPYSPDLQLFETFLFPRLKVYLKGKIWGDEGF